MLCYAVLYFDVVLCSGVVLCSATHSSYMLRSVEDMLRYALFSHVTQCTKMLCYVQMLCYAQMI